MPSPSTVRCVSSWPALRPPSPPRLLQQRRPPASRIPGDGALYPEGATLAQPRESGWDGPRDPAGRELGSRGGCWLCDAGQRSRAPSSGQSEAVVGQCQRLAGPRPPRVRFPRPQGAATPGQPRHPARAGAKPPPLPSAGRARLGTRGHSGRAPARGVSAPAAGGAGGRAGAGAGSATISGGAGLCGDSGGPARTQ